MIRLTLNRMAEAPYVRDTLGRPYTTPIDLPALTPYYARLVQDGTLSQSDTAAAAVLDKAAANKAITKPDASK